MATGYGGHYRAQVVNDVDPLMQSRLQVLVPEVYGPDVNAWALPSLAPGGGDFPAIGDVVWVSFEHGDSDYPVWESGAAPEETEPPRTGYVGKYRGTVVNNVDPLAENRLQVSVPDVQGTELTWAKACLPGGNDDLQLPALGDAVWVEFENGDLDYPTWVGVP